MASSPELRNFNFNEIETRVSEFDAILSLLNSYNQAVKEAGHKDKVITWEPTKGLGIKVPNIEETLQLVVGTNAGDKVVDVGYFNPVSGRYRLYTELIEAMDSYEELALLQSLAMQRRNALRDKLAQEPNPQPRPDYRHPIVKALYQNHDEVLIKGGLASEILETRSRSLPHNRAYQAFEVDEDSCAVVYLKGGSRRPHDDVEPDYILGLRLLGAYKQVRGFKERLSSKSIEIAERSDYYDNVNFGYVPKDIEDVPGVAIVNQSQLQRLGQLSLSVKAVKEAIPAFSMLSAAILIPPGKEPLVNEVTINS